MKLSREARRQATELFRFSMADGRLDESRLRAVADGIVERKPRQYVQMLKFLTRLARLETARHHAVIESAEELSAPVREGILSDLTRRFGQLDSEFRQTPALIGGLRVRVGSDVWDGSIQSRLEALKNS
jgi:F-type H+-transporting ATPase subunit delta